VAVPSGIGIFRQPAGCAGGGARNFAHAFGKLKRNVALPKEPPVVPNHPRQALRQGLQSSLG
jgi:hypothetical protein